LQGKTQVNDNVFGLVSTAHSSTKPGIIRAMAWVIPMKMVLAEYNQHGFYFYAHVNPIALKYQERLELMNAFFSTSRSASPPLLQIMLETMLLVSS